MSLFFSALLLQFLTPETCSRILFLYDATSFSMSFKTACSWMFFCSKMASSVSSSANFLFLFALQAWLARLFCSLILRYFSSSVRSSILIRLLFAFFVSTFTFTSWIRKLVVASSTSSGKAKLAIWVSSMIHLSRSSVSLGSTLLLFLLLLATLTGSSILPSASTAGRQSPRLASSKLTPAQTVSVLLLITSTICSTSVFCLVMCRVVVGKGSGSVKSNEAFSIISIMFVVSSGRGTVFFSIVRFSTSSSIISIGAVLVL